MSVLYNEIDHGAAAALQAVMEDGLIPAGRLDTRSIKDFTAHDFEGVHQFHTFAGAGGWAYAARLAGWPDWLPIWSGSCPCQPFSQAGKGGGVDDERHLWPDFFRVICAARPPVVVGEQVAGKAGLAWFDGVRADLAAAGYACRVVDVPAASVDAPHIRQRLYWIAIRSDLLADAESIDGWRGPERQGDGEEPAQGDGGYGHGSVAYGNGARSHAASQPGVRGGEEGAGARHGEPERRDAPGGVLGHSIEPGLEGHARHDDGARGRTQPGRSTAPADGGNGALDDRGGVGIRQQDEALCPGREPSHAANAAARNGSFYSDYEWIICHDGKSRRAQSGIRLLVDGVRGRVHQWRIAGNSIVIPLAVEVLAALLEYLTMIGFVARYAALTTTEGAAA